MIPLPAWIKPFDKVFSELTYRWDHLQIFEDFLSIAVSNFQLVPTEGLAERMRSVYSEKELQLFGELFRAWITCTDEAVRSEEWTYSDLLGNYYEHLSSKYHKSRLGQFFTPETLVEAMTEMVIGEPTEEIQTVNDPTAGSGRMLLSAHMKLKGKMLAYAEDIDGICCKICVLNFLIHGLEGEVIHHNSLLPDDWIQGWKVNPYRKMKLFNVQPIQQSESDIMKYRKAESFKNSVDQPPQNEPTEQLIINF